MISYKVYSIYVHVKNNLFFNKSFERILQQRKNSTVSHRHTSRQYTPLSVPDINDIIVISEYQLWRICIAESNAPCLCWGWPKWGVVANQNTL